MKTVGFSAGEVIFREGDAALAMYVIQKGSVGVWLDYDTEEKQQLSVLKEQQLLGEMGLIEACPRSATAVALEDGTVLEEISEEEFYEFFEKQPEHLLEMLRQLSARIRANTQQYQSACLALREHVEAERPGERRAQSWTGSFRRSARRQKRENPVIPLWNRRSTPMCGKTLRPRKGNGSWSRRRCFKDWWFGASRLKRCT